MLTDSDTKRLSEELQKHLIRLIQFNTTNPPGNETAACEYIKEQLAGVGLAGEIYESAPGRGNLVCRLRGDGSKRPVTIASHLDVVPAAAEYWSVDPFAGVAKDGFIYGRGALDMKFTAALHLVVVMEMKRRGIPLKRDLILLHVADEEMSGAFGMGYMVKNHFDKIDCEFELNEGGGYAIPLEGKNIYFCQTAEKGVCWFKITTRGESGHGAVPRADNSILQMANALRVLAEPLPIRRTAIVSRIIDDLAEKVLPFPKNIALKQIFNPLLTNLILGAIRSANKEVADTISAMMRDTISLTIVNGGNKENVIPEKCEAVIDCRILPGQTAEEFRKTLLSKVDVDEIKFLQQEVPDPTESPVETELYRAVGRAVSKHDPTGVITPFLMTGATDSRFFREKGITAYGFVPFKSSVPPDEYLPTIHGVDERVPVDGLDICLKNILRSNNGPLRMSVARKSAIVTQFTILGFLRYLRLRAAGKQVIVEGRCFQCGACCTDLNLSRKSHWIRSKAEFARLAADCPEYTRFSHIGYTISGLMKFKCECLSKEGYCSDYENRPDFCRLYPEPELYFMGGEIPAFCGYKFSIVPSFGRILSREMKRKPDDTQKHREEE